jgi:hypothetical protein
MENSTKKPVRAALQYSWVRRATKPVFWLGFLSADGLPEINQWRIRMRKTLTATSSHGIFTRFPPDVSPGFFVANQWFNLL